MNRNSAALIIVGFAGLIVGAVAGYFAFGSGRPAADLGPAAYILMFGDTTGHPMVTADLTAFQNALASPAPNWSSLQEVLNPGASPTPVPIPTMTPAPSGTVLIARVQVIQQGLNNAPCTMHVTQKVGLNDPTQVRNVLAALNPSPTPIPR
jgi:hypothetical protein